MENIPATGMAGGNEKFPGVIFDGSYLSEKRLMTNPLLVNVITEGGADFLKYLTWTGLSKEKDLMVLSPVRHYYYDRNDLKGIKALINLKKLNQVRHLENFVHTLYRILPSGSYFMGLFKNSRHRGKSAVIYRPATILRGLKCFLDPNCEQSLTKQVIKTLLEENCFTVLDMTEINGLTYFWSENNRLSGK